MQQKSTNPRGLAAVQLETTCLFSHRVTVPREVGILIRRPLSGARIRYGSLDTGIHRIAVDKIASINSAAQTTGPSAAATRLNVHQQHARASLSTSSWCILSLNRYFIQRSAWDRQLCARQRWSRSGRGVGHLQSK